jgi:CRP-like cAMP-binding protein
MHGGQKPRFATLTAGDTLARQGDAGSDLYLVLDGVVRIDRDGEQLAEYGPGAILGERAYLEAGTRTASLVAVTACRVAAVHGSRFDAGALTELASGHRREEAVQGG